MCHGKEEKKKNAQTRYEMRFPSRGQRMGLTSEKKSSHAHFEIFTHIGKSTGTWKNERKREKAFHTRSTTGPTISRNAPMGMLAAGPETGDDSVSGRFSNAWIWCVEEAAIGGDRVMEINANTRADSV